MLAGSCDGSTTAAQFLVRSMLPGLLLVLVLLGPVLVVLGLVLVLLGQGQNGDKVRRWRGLKVGGGSHHGRGRHREVMEDEDPRKAG